MDFGIGSFSTDIDVHGGLEEVGEVGRATGRRSNSHLVVVVVVVVDVVVIVNVV